MHFFVFRGRNNLFKSLEKLNFTLWLRLLHFWWFDLCPVVRGDPYTQSQQPVKLKKRNWGRKENQARTWSFTKLQITESILLCKQTNKLRTMYMRSCTSVPRKFVREIQGIVLIHWGVNTAVDTNRISQNLQTKHLCFLAILHPQSRSHLHFGGRLYEYPALTKKTTGDGINNFTTLAGLKIQSVYHSCINAFIYFTSQQRNPLNIVK